MYVPPKFAVDEAAAWEIVRDAGSGMLVINTDEGLKSVFVPVTLNDDRTIMTSHLAKANEWWKLAREGDEVLAIFLAASAYVSPSYYPSRVENPGVVPTWNYVAAEVRGTLSLRPDPEWMLNQVREVTERFEAGRSPEWTLEDSTEDYIQKQLSAIVGIEIAVTSIEGKAKLSQNRPDIDHDSVREHLAGGTPTELNVAQRMANGQ